MNKDELDIILLCEKEDISNQREISEKLNISLGKINNIIRKLVSEKYLDENYNVLEKSKKLIKQNKVKNAIILAAGIGSRMVPLNSDSPKSLLEVDGKKIIERQIEFLLEKNIDEIYVVVGYQKEKFDYLIDKYGVNLIYNERYYDYNNFYSLYKVVDKINNSYIIPSDLWLIENPFNENELYSYYLFGEEEVKKSKFKYSKQNEINIVKSGGNLIYGISYISNENCECIKNMLKKIFEEIDYEEYFWEESLYRLNFKNIYAKVINKNKIVEINSYNDLVSVNKCLDILSNSAISIIKDVFKVQVDEIKNISPLKKGMTNKSFIFEVNNEKYIMRIPGEGTDRLINRKNEYAVYKQIMNENICDEIIYINEDNGYKITKFIEHARTCDIYDKKDLESCMDLLRNFHNKKIVVEHEFDLFGQIENYEKLWGNEKSVYCDYLETKKNVYLLKDYIDKNKKEKVLTHIDAICDNFLIYKNKLNEQEIRLIDFEYSSMQDPDVDIAMFCIYALYDKEKIDELIDIYYKNKCDIKTRIKIYCYISVCGLLWSNWCEYKRILGIEFGEYSIKQYRYAKDFYKIAVNLMGE